ncbi:MAG: ABC transporter ATP-binding protein [Trueperaceae bacterium]
MISYQDVSKNFYKKGAPLQALASAKFDVASGEFVAVVGPSGCGKSTLLNMTAGLMKPTSGQVIYDGLPIQSINHRVGYMTQKDNLLPWRTVRGNIGLALELRAVRKTVRNAQVDDYIDKVGLTGFADHYPSELSGGMRKRVSLARTMIYQPETLLMDEPFGALDAQLRLLLHDLLLQVWEATGTTIVFVTHDLAEAIALADRVVVLTGRPGQVKAIQEIPLPRPRDVFNVRFTPEFGQLFQSLWDVLGQDVKKGEDI